LVGGLGVWAALRTLSAIEKQVDAMVKSERAWIKVDLENGPGKGPPLTSTSAGHRSELFVARCTCSNQGQTAARIIEKRCAMLAISGDGELPETPNLDIAIIDPVPHYLRANGDPWHDLWSIYSEFVDSEHVQVRIIYGVVRYKHMFSDKIAQTTFGYRLRFDGKLERLVGCPKYNENS
jgi:hypothetical protein